MRAPVLFANEVATEVPRLPQPSRPRRTAELAWYPKAVFDLRIKSPEAAVAFVMNFLRFMPFFLSSSNVLDL
jgi:hypothetical protein